MTPKQQREFEFTLSKLAARSSFCAVDFGALRKQGFELGDLQRDVEAYSAMPSHLRKYVVRMADSHMVVLSSPWWQPPRKYPTRPRTSASGVSERPKL